jgi:predicted acyltransferase
VPTDWPHLTGLAAHWEKNANLAASFDRWFLNLFPREEPLIFSRGGYATLNFVPSMATMTFGLLAGGLLRRDISVTRKVTWLVLFGVVGVVLGKAIALAGLCPIVKRIWTPSWAIYSAGWVTLVLAGFVAVIEGLRLKRWAFPFVVVGLNPITLYCLWQLSSGFVRSNIRRHLGQDIFESCGATYAPILERVGVLLVLWLILLWMYRRKIFVRI